MQRCQYAFITKGGDNTHPQRRHDYIKGKTVYITEEISPSEMPVNEVPFPA